MNRLLLLSAALILAATASTAGITDLDVSIADGSPARVSFNVDPSDFRPGTEGEVVIAPVVARPGAPADTLPAITVAGRTRYLRHLRADAVSPALLRAGEKRVYSYSAEFPADSAATLFLHLRRSACCGHIEADTLLEAAVIAAPPAKPTPTPPPATPAPTAVEEIFDLGGSALVTFPVNSTMLDPSYRSNTAELAKITSTVDTVLSNQDAEIRSIILKGFASPEGSYLNNMRLARGRTLAVKDYLRERYGLPEEIIVTAFEPEDWEGFRAAVETAPGLKNRAAILEAIDGQEDPDVRERAIAARFPADYRLIKSEIYPALRHTDYTVRYTIRRRTVVEAPPQEIHETEPAQVPETPRMKLLQMEIPAGLLKK